jgi:hypothetical protein
VLFGRTAIFLVFPDEDDEAMEDMLGRLGLTGSSSSAVGVGGVGVRRSCFNMANGAIFSASRWRNP